MITTDGTWNALLDIGLDKVKDFAEKEGVKREISKHGLTEREAQELIKQFRQKNVDSRRGVENVERSGRSGEEIQRTSDTEKKDGRTSNGEKISYSLDDSDDSRDMANIYNYSEKEYYNYGWARANNILNKGQNADYRSKFADAKSGKAKFKKSKKANISYQ